MSGLTPYDCDEEITKAEFDTLARANSFVRGPFKQDQSQEYGAPYIAPLWLFGELFDGRKVKAQRFGGPTP